MSWTETAPGRWERPFGYIEKVPLTVRGQELRPGRENWYETSIVKVRLNPSLGEPEQALRRAWTRLRWTFPEIAAYPQNNETYVYHVLQTASNVKAWLESTCITVPAPTTADDLMTSLSPNKLMTLHWLPHTSEIIFSSSHFRLDGPGFMSLNNSFYHALAKPEPEPAFGSESCNLSPNFETLANIPQAPWNPEIKAAAQGRLEAWQSPLPPLSMKSTYSPNAPAGVSRRVTHIVPEAQTKAIIAACRANNISVNTAQHAAVISAVQACVDGNPSSSATEPGTAPKRTFSAICAFGLRKHISHADAKPATLSSSGNVFPITVTDGSFSSHAAQLKTVYEQGFEPFLASMSCAQAMMLPFLSKPPPPDAPMQTDPVMSGLGVVDKLLDREVRNEAGEVMVVIEEFWVGLEILRAAPQLFFWTWRGKLVWTVCFNDAYWSEELIHKFLEETKKQLLKGLGIKDGDGADWVG